MTGIDAITQQNGWAMASVGAVIVLTGLTVLSLIISQLHKFVAFLEKKPEKSTIIVTEESDELSDPLSPSLCSSCPDATVELYRPLVEELDPQFKLVDLYVLAEKYHLPHPHLSIRCLRETGKLQPLGEGVFELVA